MLSFIRTRSGRYINLHHIVYISVEETKITDQGRKLEVYKIVAHLPAPMNPAVLGIYKTESEAYRVLDEIMKKVADRENIIYVPTEY